MAAIDGDFHRGLDEALIRWGFSLTDQMRHLGIGITAKNLKLAFAIAHRALRNSDYTEDALIELTAWLYNYLTDLECDGITIDEGVLQRYRPTRRAAGSFELSEWIHQALSLAWADAGSWKN